MHLDGTLHSNSRLACHSFSAAGNRILIVEQLAKERGTQFPEHAFPDSLEGWDLVGILSRVDGCSNKLEFFNRDGTKERFCGNAVRCISALPELMGESRPFKEARVVTEYCTARSFRAANGMHGVGIPETSLRLHLRSKNPYQVLVDAGTPHLVQQTRRLESPQAVEDALPGWNPTSEVNVTLLGNIEGEAIEVRIFERGVGETGSCGTGALSAFVVANLLAGDRLVPERFSSRTIRFVRSNERLTVTYDPGLKEFQISGPCQLISRGHCTANELFQSHAFLLERYSCLKSS